MRHKYFLAHLTAIGLDPPQLIDAAAAAGYDYVGLRLNRTTTEEPLYDLINDRGLMKETKARLADTGVKVWDIEVARMDPPREWFTWSHVCDVPAEHPATLDGLIHQGRRERMFSGEGGIAVKDILGSLPNDIVYALEIPGETLVAEVGYKEYVRRALRAAQRYLDDSSEI
jgi:sugar phosphate isomerase/epimerase